MDKFIIEIRGKCFGNGEKSDIYKVHDRAKNTIVGTKNNNYGWNEKIRRPKDDANNKHSQE